MNNSAMPPQNPSHLQAQAPASVGSRNTDLYDEITRDREDEETVSVPVKKKRQSPFMFLVVCFMKVTFYLDSVRRSHETFFHFLGGIWAGFMGLIYLGGIITLLLSFYARLRLPLVLEDFFKSHHLKYDTLKMADYSLSKINIFNLHDDAGKYSIPQLNIHSTFADFLQGRIRTVTAEGLELNLRKEDSSQNDLGNIFGVLGIMANPMEAGLDLKINSISIKNAILNIEEQGTKIPINFQMEGLYTTDSKVIIPFSVNENFLEMKASLTITGSANDRKLDLAITSGKLALENRPPEDMEGTVIIQLDKDKINDVKSKLNLNYGHSLKVIETKLTNSGNGFDGTFSFVYKNTAEKDADSKPLADLFLKFKDLKITREGYIETSSPLQIKINRLIYNTTLLEGIDSDLNGQMNCSLKEGECRYTLSEAARIQYSNLALKYKGQSISINESGNVLLHPSLNTFAYKLANSELILNWNLSNVNLSGFYNAPNNFLRLKTNSAQVAGHFWNDFQKNNLDVNIHDASYQTPHLQMNGVNLEAKNLMDETSPVIFSAKNVLTSSTLLTRPVSINISYLNRQIKADVSIDNSDIRLTAEGILKPFQKVFVGQFRLFPVNLKKLPFSLSELSPLFSDRITDLSGEMMALGQLNFSGQTNIGGPLYVGLKDVGFRLDETEIQNVNGVIALQSLSPLISAPKQTLSIGKIKSQVPLTNIIGSFQLENQALRLLSIDAKLGKEPLMMTNALIPYRAPSALLYLKSTKDFKMDNFAPYLNVPGVTLLGGTGSLSIPISISEGEIDLASTVLKINNVTFQKGNGKRDVIGFFKKGNNAFMVRTGQLILDGSSNLQIDLDGWLMPMRKKDSFTKDGITLTSPLFKSGEITSVPSEITDRQRLLFQTLSESK